MAKMDEKMRAKEAKRAEKAERRRHRRKAQAVLTQAQIGAQLRALASQVDSGSLVLGDQEIALPEKAKYEISYQRRRKGGHEIEVEIQWGGTLDAALLPTD
jgi:amphi-Trp domain-containing protein